MRSFVNQNCESGGEQSLRQKQVIADPSIYTTKFSRGIPRTSFTENGRQGTYSFERESVSRTGGVYDPAAVRLKTTEVPVRAKSESASRARHVVVSRIVRRVSPQYILSVRLRSHKQKQHRRFGHQRPNYRECGNVSVGAVATVRVRVSAFVFVSVCCVRVCGCVHASSQAASQAAIKPGSQPSSQRANHPANQSAHTVSQAARKPCC